MARHAHKKSTATGSSFRINVEGSDPAYSFHYLSKNPYPHRLLVFEAPIDMLSYISLHPHNWKSASYVALNGVSEKPILKLLELYPQLDHVVLCLDHDTAGIEAAERIYDTLIEQGQPAVGQAQSKYKDWNEDLKAKSGFTPIPAEEHPQLLLRDEICKEINRYAREHPSADCSAIVFRNILQNCKDNRVMIFADEIGTIPKIQSMEMMFSAGRSRRISMVPIIQSFAQLEKNYGKEGSAIIIDNCQDILFGGFAPNSESADILSRALGNKTVMSGSISRGKNDPSQSLQMIQRPLMTPDELKTLSKGNFILAKTGCYPMRTKLPLFLKWGIRFEKPFEVEERAARKVAYADRFELEQEIMNRRCAYDEDDFAEFPEPPGGDRSGGTLYTPVQEHESETEPPAMPLRTD